MNRRISMVLAAIAASAVATPALANDPGKMFMINAVTPGVVSFSGEGTAQFNNASTTANAFSVGSSSNFGVNASASSTLDYMVDANALLQLAGTSQLQQTIGTSSSAANTQAASQAAMEAATNVAEQEVNETMGETWADYVAMNGGTEAQITAATAGGTNNGAITIDANGGFDGALETSTAYNAERNKQINAVTKETFASTVESANSSASSGQNADGVISGSFDSSSYSRSDIGATASAIQSYVETARAEADAKFGSEYNATADGTGYMDKFDQFDISSADGSAGGDGQLDANEQASAAAAGLSFDVNAQGMGVAVSSTDWTATRNAAIESTVSDMTNQASSNGQSESKNNADVTVTGIGSIATLNASDDSAFNVDVATRIRTQLMTTNGTANGSAGGNLATSSFANQSLSQSASAFIQAFGADTVQLDADSNGNLTGAVVSGRLNVGIGVDTTNNDNLTVTVPAD